MSVDPVEVRLSREDLDRLTAEPRYVGEDLLGRGGVGEVHRCRDVRIGRSVARKTIRNELRSSNEITLRMLREAVLQGQLDHPAIVPVYDLGMGPHGLFFTMRYIQGVTLLDVLNKLASGDLETRRRFGRRHLLNAFVTVCLAVDYAHKRGIAHRDLKPGNVMLGAFGEVYVLDWGAAKLLGEEPGGKNWENRQLTNKNGGPGIGTPGYMAPEQLQGELLDERADIYALGAILFRILTLENMHQGDALQKLQSTLLPARTPSAIRPDVPPELDAICLKAVAVDPSQRFSSARDLADALLSFLDAQGDSLPPGPSSRGTLPTIPDTPHQLSGHQSNPPEALPRNDASPFPTLPTMPSGKPAHDSVSTLKTSLAPALQAEEPAAPIVVSGPATGSLRVALSPPARPPAQLSAAQQARLGASLAALVGVGGLLGAQWGEATALGRAGLVLAGLVSAATLAQVARSRLAPRQA